MSLPVIVPLSQDPTQSAAITLGGQAVQYSLRQNGANMYFDLLLADQTPILLAMVCRNVTNLLADRLYAPFVGSMYFEDTQGDTQPVYTGLGTRYLLYYWDGLPP